MQVSAVFSPPATQPLEATGGVTPATPDGGDAFGKVLRQLNGSADQGSPIQADAQPEASGDTADGGADGLALVEEDMSDGGKLADADDQATGLDTAQLLPFLTQADINIRQMAAATTAVLEAASGVLAKSAVTHAIGKVVAKLSEIPPGSAESGSLMQSAMVELGPQTGPPRVSSSLSAPGTIAAPTAEIVTESATPGANSQAARAGSLADAQRC